MRRNLLDPSPGDRDVETLIPFILRIDDMPAFQQKVIDLLRIRGNGDRCGDVRIRATLFIGITSYSRQSFQLGKRRPSRS